MSPAAREHASSGDSGLARLAAAAAALVVLVAFLPALANDFVDYDDFEYVALNPALGGGLASLVRGAFLETRGAYWLPLLWLSYGLDRALWGEAAWGFHLGNILLHALDVFWVGLLGAALAGHLRPEASARHRALVGMLTALLWGLHPLRVESVAWISERKDVLAAAFGLPALLAWLRFAAGRRAATVSEALRDASYRRCLLLLLLSLTAKGSFAVAPIALLALDAWPLRRDRLSPWRLLVAEKLPLLALGILSAVATLLTQRPALLTFGEASPFSRLLVACHSTVAYLVAMAWPSGLSPYYPHPGESALTDPSFALSALLVGAVSVTGAVLWRRHRAPLVLWSLYLLPLAPVVGLVQSGSQGRADRFTYLPALAPTLAIAWFLVAAITAGGTGITGSLRRIGSGAVAVALLAASAVGTIRQIPVWRDTESLWSRVIEVSNGKLGMAYFNRARFRHGTGDHLGALSDLDAALDIARTKRYRRTAEVLAERGRVLLALGRCHEAVADLTAAIDGASAPLVADLAARATARAACGDADGAAADRQLVAARDGNGGVPP